jgi:hypothetical protein
MASFLELLSLKKKRCDDWAVGIEEAKVREGQIKRPLGSASRREKGICSAVST